MTMFSYEFMQRALIAALLTGLAAPAIGTYLVQRRLALIGDGIGHVAITGVALGLLTGTAPLVSAVVVCIVGAVAIEWVRARGRTSGDVALALLFYGGIAGGVMLVSFAGQGAAALNTYLFGSLTTVSSGDLLLVAVLAALVLAFTVGLYPQLSAVCTDEAYARTTGLPVRALTTGLAIAAALSVTVAMRTVGLLLVSALMVVPVAAAQQVARSFRATFVGAGVVGVVACLIGVTFSYNVDVPPGATIVLAALAIFMVCAATGALVRRRAGAQVPAVAAAVIGVDPPAAADVPARPGPTTAHGHDHEDHVHGDDCGHPAIPHGDHVDYLHGGHLHAEHGDHYDEH